MVSLNGIFGQRVRNVATSAFLVTSTALTSVSGLVASSGLATLFSTTSASAAMLENEKGANIAIEFPAGHEHRADELSQADINSMRGYLEVYERGRVEAGDSSKDKPGYNNAKFEEYATRAIKHFLRDRFGNDLGNAIRVGTTENQSRHFCRGDNGTVTIRYTSMANPENTEAYFNALSAEALLPNGQNLEAGQVGFTDGEATNCRRAPRPPRR